MDNKIGNFIRELRKENNMSQQKLSDLVPIDRSVVSKWERGEVQPPIDKIIILCNIFNITIDEILCGERLTESNKKSHQETLSKYLIKQESKYIKAKKCAILSSVIAFLIIFLFLGYYFYQTYNTEKVYRIYSMSNNYNIKDGILIVTREKTYFKIGGINDDIFDISLIYKINGNSEELYKGSSDSVLIDFNKYDGLINNSNIESVIDNLYIIINGEEIQLKFNEDYKNDNLILEDKTEIGNDNNVTTTTIFPVKVKKNFECNDMFCSKTDNCIKIDYIIDDNAFYIKDNNATIQYDISSKIFDYTSNNISFSVKDENIICNDDKCEEYEKIYNKYYTNLIKKYIY